MLYHCSRKLCYFYWKYLSTYMLFQPWNFSCAFAIHLWNIYVLFSLRIDFSFDIWVSWIWHQHQSIFYTLLNNQMFIKATQLKFFINIFFYKITSNNLIIFVKDYSYLFLVYIFFFLSITLDLIRRFLMFLVFQRSIHNKMSL